MATTKEKFLLTRTEIFYSLLPFQIQLYTIIVIIIIIRQQRIQEKCFLFSLPSSSVDDVDDDGK